MNMWIGMRSNSHSSRSPSVGSSHDDHATLPEPSMSVANTRDDASEVRAQIEVLVAEFAWRIDHRSGHGVATLFTRHDRYMAEGDAFGLQDRVQMPASSHRTKL